MQKSFDLQKLVERIFSLLPQKSIHKEIVECDIAPHFFLVVQPEMVVAAEIDRVLYRHRNGSLDKYDFVQLQDYDTTDSNSFFLTKEMNLRKMSREEAMEEAEKIVSLDGRNHKLYGKITLKLRTTIEFSMEFHYLVGVAVPKKDLN